MSDAFIHFFLGMTVSFTGSLPPGVINLTVMDTAARKSFRESMLVAATAAFVEFFQAFIAILFSSFFVQTILVSSFIQYSAVPVFLLLSGFFFFKDKLIPKKTETKNYSTKGIVKGLIVGVVNVQVIPFWVFWSSYFATNKWIDFNFDSIAIFSAGITIGTTLALFLYARLGRTMSNKTSVMAFWGNKTLGIIFITFAIYQLVRIIKT